MQVPQAPKKTTTASSRRNGQEEEASGTTSTGTGQKVLLSDLQNFLSGLQGSAEGGAAAAAAAAVAAGGRSVDLASAINAETLEKISTDAEQSKWLPFNLNSISNSI